MTVQNPLYLQPKGYTAKQDRQLAEDIFAGAKGVPGSGDFFVTAGSGMTVVAAAGDAIVRGTSTTRQGSYKVVNDASVTINVASSDPTNPRVDAVILRVYDSTETGSGSDIAQCEMVTGTATGGATLDNRTGAASLPASYIHLADVLVPASSSSVSAGNVRDRRPFHNRVSPPLLSDIDQVGFEAIHGQNIVAGNAEHALHDGDSNAAAMYLPRRIVSATRIRWKYMHTATAMTGNYVLGVFDASGRSIVNTGTVAFTGAANTVQVRSETISSTTFDAGMYWVFWGLDSTAGECYYPGIQAAFTGGLTQETGVAHPNLLVASITGTTVPTTLLSHADQGTSTTATALSAVPLVALSVG